MKQSVTSLQAAIFHKSGVDIDAQVKHYLIASSLTTMKVIRECNRNYNVLRENK